MDKVEWTFLFRALVLVGIRPYTSKGIHLICKVPTAKVIPSDKITLPYRTKEALP